MLITTLDKRALRRVQADRMMTKRQLAMYVGVSEKTIQLLTKDESPQEVKLTTYKKIMSAISSNY